MKYLINQDTLNSLGDAVRKISNTTNKMNMMAVFLLLHYEIELTRVILQEMMMVV